MQDINLLEALEKAQLELNQAEVVKEVERILSNDLAEENKISQRLQSSKLKVEQLNCERLDTSKMFDIESIEQICTTFRLRFLSSDLFKGEVPSAAVREIKRIESQAGIKFNQFMIIAPQERFELVDSTKDPILMAELPNGKYYYIFQWGNDMEWYHRFLKYPFRHIGTLAITSSAIGFLIALLVPSQFAGWQAEFFYRFFMFSMSSALVMTLAIIVGIMYSKDFSENVWNSKFIK